MVPRPRARFMSGSDLTPKLALLLPAAPGAGDADPYGDLRLRYDMMNAEWNRARDEVERVACEIVRFRRKRWRRASCGGGSNLRWRGWWRSVEVVQLVLVAQ